MANILKQVKVGNTTYNIEPVTAYLPLTGGTINANNSKAPLILKGGASNWNEGLRIIPTNNWATILLAGTDADENTGTSAKSWSIHNYDGSFYISKNGSDYASTKLSNTDGTWRVNDNDIIHSGNIGSQNVNYANSAGSVAWGNVTGKPSTFTPSGHTHDDRYYTESEVNSKLDGKSNTNHTHSYLPLSGGSLTGTLNLFNNAKIAFTDSWYITNIESGTKSITLGASNGTEAYVDVTYHNGSKGSGTWYMVATASGSHSDNVSIGLSNTTNTGFRLWVRNVYAASQRNLTINWIAIKYW